jgi:hypothetical protein
MVTNIGLCSLCGGDVQIQDWHQPDATVAHCADCGAVRDMRMPVIAMRAPLADAPRPDTPVEQKGDGQ